MINKLILTSYVTVLQAFNTTLHPTEGLLATELGLANQISSKCAKASKQVLLKILAEDLKDPRTKAVYDNSGDFIQELGRYESCSESKEDVTYYLIQAGIDVLRFNIGLCVPTDCSVEDWRVINELALEEIRKSGGAQGNPLEGYLEYFVLDMTNVEHSTRTPDFLLDPHYGLFLVLAISIFGVVTLCSLHQAILKYSRTNRKEARNGDDEKSKNQRKTNSRAHVQGAMSKTDQRLVKEGPSKDTSYNKNIQGDYEGSRLTQILRSRLNLHEKTRSMYLKSISFLEIFDIKTNLLLLKKQRMDSPLEVSLDFLRIIVFMTTLAMNYVFVHTLTSQVFTDMSTIEFFLFGSQAAALQISFFLPDIMLFIGGYVGAKSVMRTFKSFEDKKFLKDENGVLDNEGLDYLVQFQGGSDEHDMEKDERRRRELELGEERRKFDGELLIKVIISPFLYGYFAVKRYLRFFPLLLLTLIYEWKILPLVATGPLAASDLKCTRDTFFSTLLLFNNKYTGEGKMCSPWLWYLKVDFELFMVVPIICLLFKFLPKMAIGISTLLGVSCIAFTAHLCQSEKIKVMNAFDGMWFIKIMNRAATRGGMYFFGIALALYCYRMETTTSKKKAKKEHEMEPKKPKDLIVMGRISLPVNLQSIREELEVSGTLDIGNCTRDMEEEKQLPSSQEVKPTHSGQSIKTEVINIDYSPDSNLDLKRIATLGACSILFLAYFSIVKNRFQDYEIWSNQPQTLHSFYNATAGPAYAISIAGITWAVVSSYKFEKLVRSLKSNTLFIILRNIYFEVFLVHMSFILTRNFSLKKLSGFSYETIVVALPIEFAMTIILALAVHIFVTRPLQNLWYKLLEMPIVYGIWPGVFEFEDRHPLPDLQEKLISGGTFGNEFKL